MTFQAAPTMQRNIVALKGKAAKHQVLSATETSNIRWDFQVRSGGSGTTYSVVRRVAQKGEIAGQPYWTCDCKFSQGYKGGCSHIAAAAATFEAVVEERSSSIHSGLVAAQRQHRPVEHLGQNLYQTTRAS